MFKNRFILVLGVISLLLVTMAVSRPFSAAPTSKELSWPPRPIIARVAASNNLSDFYQRHADWTSLNNSLRVAASSANDFYQRHPDWTSTSNVQAAAVPVTGALDLSDYYLRHPELRVTTGPAIDMSDYFLRHPELIVSTGAAIDTSDYFFRHPELSAPAQSVDLSDYFLRHPELIIK